MEIKNTNHIFTNDLKPSERFAIWITYRIGTIGFFLIIFFWTLLWLGWNMFDASIDGRAESSGQARRNTCRK